MKTKLVLWGTNEKEEKILVGIELLEQENSIKIYIVPEAEAKEDFANQLLNEWRIGNPIIFPENHQVIERPLSVTENLLPDEIKVARTDVINRAKAEWHFVVLSAKLYQLYKSQVEEFKEKTSQLDQFDKSLWEELKGFWQKVQEQVYEKNLFKEHAKELQDETNSLFDQLKKFRKKLDQEFQAKSKERSKAIREKLDSIESKLKEGLGLQPLWNELKNTQSNFKNEKLARNDRNELWSRIDALFKQIKEKKYGSAQGGGKNNALERIQNRYKGLLSAIKKMENSIKWDKKDLKFQGDRIEETHGQLEQEIRKAKLVMIEERVKSKEAKLGEMLQTKVMLESKIQKEEEKVKKYEASQKSKEIQAELKAKIKQEIAENSKTVDAKLDSAAAAIRAEQAAKKKAQNAKKKNEESSAPKEKEDQKAAPTEDSIMEVISESAEDLMDTLRATAKVIGGKISDAIDEMKNEEE